MREIIIKKEVDNTIQVILCENGTVVEDYQETMETNRLEGNIYIGKVQNILPGMQAAFIDIGEEKNAFIHLKDILLEQEKKEEVYAKNIKNHIKAGETMVVQVRKDATKQKGARVSKDLNIPSQFIVLLPKASFITISQKIEKEEEKKRLLQLVKKNLPQNYGAIIRTAAENRTEEEIKADIQRVLDKWEKIKEQIEQAKTVPCKIYQDQGLLHKMLIDLTDQKINIIWLNEDKIKEDIDNIIKEEQLEAIDVRLEKKKDLFQLYEIGHQLEKLKNRRIWLRCGGFISIDKTEALTAIDVNSGKYTGKQSIEQTIVRVNKEASVEIAKQIRLRDIGGIIIIDYIDMFEEKDKQEIIQILKENLKKDRAKTQIVGFTKLNLLEMTRKHICSDI